MDVVSGVVVGVVVVDEDVSLVEEEDAVLVVVVSRRTAVVSCERQGTSLRHVGSRDVHFFWIRHTTPWLRKHGRIV